jgi:hypothetical protein
MTLTNKVKSRYGANSGGKESGGSLNPYPNKTLRTIGGGNGRGGGGTARGAKLSSGPASKVKGDDGTGSFELLHDDDSVGPDGQPGGLWPSGYQSERETTVSGTRAPSETSSGGGIPLASIGVRQELSWTENRATADSKV